MRLLGVDYGTRRIGLAISDADRKIALPLTVLARQGDSHDAAFFRRLLADEKVAGIVVGLPARTTGQEGGKAAEARAFGDWLQQATGLPVSFWDERFTSADAEQLLQQGGLTSKRRKARIDMVAAQIMLQSYLDAGCPDRAEIEPLEDN